MTPRRRRGALVLVAAVLVGPWLAAAAAPAATPTVPPPLEVPTTVAVPDQFPLLDRPNSGRPPVHSTDFGGWAQFAVLGGIVVAVAGGILLIRRESRRKLAQAYADPSTRASTRSEPQADRSTNRPDSSARQ